MAAFANPGRRVGAPGNFAQSGRLGFAVGDPDFLDSEASKIRAYWRGLEHGSIKFLNRRITGLWSNMGGPRGRLITGGPLSAFGEGFEQKLVPFVRPQENVALGIKRALRYLRETDPQAHRGHVSGLIQNPIVAQNAYRDAVRQFDPLRKEASAVEQVLRNQGFTSGGYMGGRHGVVRGGQSFTRFADVRSRRPAPISSRDFVARTGFLTGSATSGYTASLVNFDKVFQRELTQINKLLAEGLAAEVAKIQKERIKRDLTSSGRLIAATLNPKNRFPS